MEPTTNPTGEYLREEETFEARYETAGKKKFAEQSPDEVRRSVKEKVKKGIASVAGALEGLNEEVEQDHLPEKTEQAVHNVGETTRKVAGAAREETRQTKDSLKQAVQAAGETTREVAGAAKEETRQTKDSLKQAVQAAGETTRDVAGAAKEETEKTQDALGKEKQKELPGMEEPISGLGQPENRRTLTQERSR